MFVLLPSMPRSVRSFPRVVPSCLVSALVAASTVLGAPPSARVLVISIDGLHDVDLANHLAAHPDSALARLAATAVRYTSASTVRPSDSFPTFLALFTGGSPASTGVYYDDSYDRSLWPPGITEGPVGTEVVFTELVDINFGTLDGGGGISVDALPRDPKRGGAPVWPHDFVRVNTAFEVVRAAGGRTALCEKHLSYEIANGPSGQGVDDLYTPEIASYNVYGTSLTKSLAATEAYDDLKVSAVISQIGGHDHTGTGTFPVPTLFAMNFQALSVAQKAKSTSDIKGKSIAGAGGYADGFGTPGPLVAEALAHTDASIGNILSALGQQGLLDSTYIVLTGKHGNSPMDPARLNQAIGVDYPGLLAASEIPTAKVTADDGVLIWLQDPAQAPAAVAVLRAGAGSNYAEEIFAGAALKELWADPATDSRVPDIIVFPRPGTVFTSSSKKIAEHGGGAEDDTHVGLLISNPRISPLIVRTPVSTTQVAPTLLQLLGLDPFLLKAVVMERTPVLPGFEALQVASLPVLSPGKLAFEPLALAYTANGLKGLQLTETSRRTYILQRSADLLVWQPLATNTVPLRATISLEDPGTPPSGDFFYRAVVAP